MTQKNVCDISTSKSKALQDAMSQIEKTYGKGSIMKLGQVPDTKVEVISTGSLVLDAALGVGGLPKGRIIEVFGHESSGKTTLALSVIASCQKDSGVCAFIDAEHALDPGYARKLGVNTNDMLLSQPDSGEQALEIVDTLVRSGSVDLIVVDSVAALVPQNELDGDINQPTMGGHARLMSSGLRKIIGSVSKTNCTVLFINQVRSKIQTGYAAGPSETTTGGRALPFYSSVRIEVRKEKTIYSKDEPIGTITQFKIVKNKMAPPFKKVSLEILYGTGISREGEILDVGEQLGILDKSGSYYYYDGEKLGQGKENVRELLKQKPELALKIEGEIRAKFGSVVIDEEDHLESSDKHQEDV